MNSWTDPIVALLDGDAIAGVCHYIHLNPVRAGIAEAVKLETFVDSSFYQLWKPRKRWNYAVFDSYLDAAGNLKECPKGRRLYRDYLGWLSEDDAERKRLGFERMTRGWAKGSKDFKKKKTEGVSPRIHNSSHNLSWSQIEISPQTHPSLGNTDGVSPRILTR